MSKKSILALAGCFHLLLALDAGLFIMLALAHFSQNTRTGALTLEALKSAFQRFVFLHTDFRHLYPPLRTSRLSVRRLHGGWRPYIDYSAGRLIASTGFFVQL